MSQANHQYPACIMLCLIASVSLLSGCQHVDVAQMTYEALRADDCRRNQLEDFCARTYAFEYHEYRRLRQDFLYTQESPYLRIPYLQEPLNEVTPDRVTFQDVLNTE